MRELKPEKTVGAQSAEALCEWYEASVDSSVQLDKQVRALMWYYGGLMRERRRELKMTQQELAAKVGARTCLISKVEKGEADIQLSSFIRIMNALDLHADFQF